MSPQLRQRIALAAALALTLWATWYVGEEEESAPTVAHTERASRRSVPLKSDAPSKGGAPVGNGQRELAWPERPLAETPIVDVFAPPPPPASLKPPPAVAVKPTAPLLSVVYLGRFAGEGVARAFLADASGAVSVLAAGDSLPGGWRLAAIESQRLVFRHAEFNQEQLVPTREFQ